MSDRIHGGVKAGKTSVSIWVGPIRKTADSSEKTGLVYNTSGLTAYYCRQGGTPTAITLATLSAIDSAYSSGGFKEADATNQKGIYRLDLPDAMVATGADSVMLAIQGTDFFTWPLFIPLESQGAAEVKTVADAIKAKTDNLPSAFVKNVARTITFKLRKRADFTKASGLAGTITTKVRKDSGAYATTTNAATESGSTGSYDLVLTSTEMNADRITLEVEDPSLVALPYDITYYTVA